VNSSETFQDHVKELRNRFLVVLICVAIFSVIGYIGRNLIINFIHRPLGTQLYYTTPAGAFNLMIKISIIVGVFLTIPILLYNVIRFMEPALAKKLSKSHIHTTIFFSCLLAVVGAAFGYFILLPLSLHFFGGYSSKNIAPLLSANDYFNYVINLIIAFAILFQIPLIMDFINRVKPFKPKQLMKYQKYVIVSAIVIALVLPFTYDPITQFVVAIPIIALYYFSVLIIMISNRQTKTEKIRQKYSTIPSVAKIPASYTPAYEISKIEPKNIQVQINQPEKIIQKPVARPESKYFDVAPTGSINQESLNVNLRKKQQIIKQLPKTRFIDGFRPVITA